ncbi:hypothetical protein ACN76_20840 [Escherichia coli]|nr:hypothetical protein ACN76_20840 [Escherichia coli]
MTSLKTSIKTITYLSDIGCLEIQGASLEPTHSDYSCCVSLIVITHCAIFLNAYNGLSAER